MCEQLFCLRVSNRPCAGKLVYWVVALTCKSNVARKCSCTISVTRNGEDLDLSFVLALGQQDGRNGESSPLLEGLDMLVAFCLAVVAWDGVERTTEGTWYVALIPLIPDDDVC